jgi:hypothetical protein
VRRGSVRFSDADEAYLAELFARRLRYGFGYADLRAAEAEADRREARASPLPALRL